MRNKFKIFSGTSGFPLAQKVAKSLGITLGKAEVVRFADGECRVRIEEKVKGMKTFVIQSLCPPVDENLMELSLFGDALKRSGAEKIVAIIPYLGYARQDRPHRPGECVSSQVVAKIIETAFEEIITLEAHSPQALSYFRIPVVHLSTVWLLSGKIRGYGVVAPDEGRRKMASNFRQILKTWVLEAEKERDKKTGKIKIKNTQDLKKVKGKKVVIVDDLIAGGGTVILVAEAAKLAGAEKIWAAVTHPVLVGEAPLRLADSVIEKVLVTDTIPVPPQKRFKKLKIVSVANLLAEEIKKL